MAMWRAQDRRSTGSKEHGGKTSEACRMQPGGRGHVVCRDRQHRPERRQFHRNCGGWQGGEYRSGETQVAKNTVAKQQKPIGCCLAEEDTWHVGTDSVIASDESSLQLLCMATWKTQARRKTGSKEHGCKTSETYGIQPGGRGHVVCRDRQHRT
jgi:hypothetical protein